mgnify:CR=1 FL=1
MFLTLFFISILLSSANVYADETDFNPILGYFNTKTNANLIYDPVRNKSDKVIYSYVDKPDFIVNLSGENGSTIPNGQILLYVNTCWNLNVSQIPSNSDFIIKNIVNNNGTVNELVQIGYTVEDNKCNFSSTWKGTLVRVVYSLSYNFNRDTSTGFSYLNSDLSFNYENLNLSSNTTTKYVNLFLSNYNESVVNSIKQQQISEKTNTYLQQQINEQQITNDKLDNILDNTPPDLNGLSDTSTWLPKGPVDSIIMLPLNFINTLISKLGATCSPINLPLPFMQNKILSLPCVSSLFAQIDGFDSLYNLIGVIGSVYLLYNYFIRFYKWIDDTLSFRENNWQDWGGD